VTVSTVVPSAGSTRAAAPSATQGVTDDEIVIVDIVPDLDSLREKGIDLGPKSTTARALQQFAGFVEAYGPVNGRKVVVKPVGWDPIDNTSFDQACTSATQDEKPFVVVNPSGFRQASIACVTVDNKTPFFMGDMAYSALTKASGNKLVSIGVPPEVAARTAARTLAKSGLIPKTAKIGILSNNDPGVKPAGDTLQSELRKLGYDVVSKVELNGLASDTGVLAREAGAAATTFQAEGVDTVFNTQSWSGINAFFAEASRLGWNYELFAVDGQANTCTPSAAGRIIALAVGATCVTAWDSKAMATKDGIRPDTAFEAKCREQYEGFMGGTTQPGGPDGEETVNGVTYSEDVPPNECTMAIMLMDAINKAGRNLTWEKVYANLQKVTNGPIAYMSQGKGGFGKSKPFFPKQMHVVTLTGADADTPQDANGLYNGCPIPVNCWVPQAVDGQEWFPVAASAK
jgi:hypothetical protein